MPATIMLMANQVHAPPRVDTDKNGDETKPTEEQFPAYLRTIEAEFNRVLLEVSPKTEEGKPVLLAYGQEKVLSVVQHKALLVEETQLLVQRLDAVKKVVDARALLKQCERQVADAKAALICQYISSVEDLERFRIDWEGLRDRVNTGYHSDLCDGSEENDISGEANETKEFEHASDSKSQETSESTGHRGAQCDKREKGGALPTHQQEEATQNIGNEKRFVQPLPRMLPRLEDLPLVSNIGQQLIRHGVAKLPSPVISNEKKSHQPTSKQPIPMETTYVKVEANGKYRLTPSPSQVGAVVEKPPSEGSTLLDGSFVNAGEDQATVLRNMLPMNDRMPQPDFDESVTMRSFGDPSSESTNHSFAFVRPQPPKLRSAGLLSPVHHSHDDNGTESSSSRPSMPAFNQRTTYGAPSMPVFRAAHVWNKGEQLSDNHNALKPSIGQSSAFKPVADSAGDGKRKGLPTPLRQYHRRSRSMAQDPASDASYMIASSDSKENVDGQQQPAILRVAPFTVREYDRLTATVRCQLELTDLNAGVAALNQFIESAEATVFTRKTLQKAVSSCLDSKRAMFFTNALSEASKLSRMNTAHNQTVFASNA